MKKQTEALKLALEALENLPEMCGIEEAITTIREALAEQPAQQKPVAREHITNGNPCWCEPETNYKDPETGISVIVHKEMQ